MFIQKIVLIVLLVGLGVGRPAPYLSCNYDPAAVNEYVFVSSPLEVPLSLPRSSDPRPPTPIHQKYHLRHYSPNQPNLDIPGLKPRMVHIDFVLVYQMDPPQSFFEERPARDYHLLESLQFVVMLSNPSEIFTICLNEIFSDSESVTKTLRRPLPICINPYTKYPLHFNLYVTALKNREMMKPGIFFNATVIYEGQTVLNRIWMTTVTFNLLPNHLRLYSLELRNCKQDSSIVSIKNPEKNELALMIQYRHKKFYMNNQPFDEKVTLGPGKVFRFMIEGRDATMTIYTYSPDNPAKTYPPLYIPLYCLEPILIEHVPIGILSAPNLALTYPIMVTSHSAQTYHIEHISLQSTSQAVELINLPTHKIVVHSNERMVRIGSFIIRSAREPSSRNTIMIQIHYQQMNSSTMARMKRELFYSEQIGVVEIGKNRFYELATIREEFNQTEKMRNFNHSVTNRLQIPIRVERLRFNPQSFRMQWFAFTGTYVYPNQVQQEIFLEYIGPKEIPVSPFKYLAVMELSGGIHIPFETMVYDNTLYCKHQGREGRCSKLKAINFGYQKTEQNSQAQVLTIANLNPTNISLTIQPYSLPKGNIQLSISIGKPFPFYHGAIEQVGNTVLVHLRSGHAINITFQVKVNETTVGDMLLDISTPYEKIQPHLKFHFETGKLIFEHEIVKIPYSDRAYRGCLNLSSTYRQKYSIKEVIAQTSNLMFEFDEQREYGHQETAVIPFVFNPHQQHNISQECCGQEFIKNKYFSYLVKGEEETAETYEVVLVTSSEVQAKAQIDVEGKKASLLESQNHKIQINALKVRFGGTVCFNVHNPYEGTLKYAVSLIPSFIVDKPKDYFTYLKYAKREKVQVYFCVDSASKNAAYITPSNLKELFRIEDNPKELVLRKPGSGDKDQMEKTNLSANDYLNSFRVTSNEKCYRFSGTLYFKLLIQSDLINDIMEEYPFEYVKRLILLEHQYLSESTFTAIYDQFYAVTPIYFEKYCKSAVYPIFRFCQHLPLKALVPNFSHEHSRRQKRYRHNSSRLIAAKGEEEVCFLVSEFHSRQDMEFYLVIANNHSKFDDYKVSVTLVEPKIEVGDISFEENHKINHETFIKHYFSALYEATNRELMDKSVTDCGITHKSKIIPVYFTNDDYRQRFGVFKGSRYFQLVNHAPIDVEFSHYGFGHLENVRFFEGFSIEQVGAPAGSYKIPGNSKSTFRIDFRIDKSFYINDTNPYFHHSLTLYFYKATHYHIQLHLAIKIAGNVLAKLQAKQDENNSHESRSIGYVLLNLMSFVYICLVIWQLKKQEDAKKNRIKMFEDKQANISGLSSKQNETSFDDQNVNVFLQKNQRNRYILPPQAIGTRIGSAPESIYKICAVIQEQDLAFLKSTLSREERSIMSQSSQSEPQIRLNFDEERLKTDEDSRSQKSLERSQVSEVKQESSELNSSQMEKQDEGYSDGESEDSLTESMLPDGISVCNQQIDMDEEIGFEFGFEKEKTKKNNEKKNSNEEYKWFESQNPLKKDKEPFPWMAAEKEKRKRTRYTGKHRKEE